MLAPSSPLTLLPDLIDKDDYLWCDSFSQRSRVGSPGIHRHYHTHARLAFTNTTTARNMTIPSFIHNTITWSSFPEHLTKILRDLLMDLPCTISLPRARTRQDRPE